MLIDYCVGQAKVGSGAVEAAERCYQQTLDELNARLVQQATDRRQLDQRRTACFQRLQHESCLIRNQLQACHSRISHTESV